MDFKKRFYLGFVLIVYFGIMFSRFETKSMDLILLDINPFVFYLFIPMIVIFGINFEDYSQFLIIRIGKNQYYKNKIKEFFWYLFLVVFLFIEILIFNNSKIYFGNYLLFFSYYILYVFLVFSMTYSLKIRGRGRLLCVLFCILFAIAVQEFVIYQFLILLLFVVILLVLILLLQIINKDI